MLSEQLAEQVQLVDRGDTFESEDCFATIYEELHGLARRELRRNVRPTVRAFSCSAISMKANTSEIVSRRARQQHSHGKDG
jgi:hypothetical protein